MENKILEAVKALGGDLANCNQWSSGGVVCVCINGSGHNRVGDFTRTNGNHCHKTWREVCTASEFNTYAEQWIKEAYMHNAAADCGFDIDNRCMKNLVVNVKDAVLHFGVYVCTKQEFIDYCEANNPKPNTAPVFTQAMADAGELPPVGVEVLHRRKGSNAWLENIYCLLII